MWPYTGHRYIIIATEHTETVTELQNNVQTMIKYIILNKINLSQNQTKPSKSGTEPSCKLTSAGGCQKQHEDTCYHLVLLYFKSDWRRNKLHSIHYIHIGI